MSDRNECTVTEVRVEHSGDAVEAFRVLLPLRQRAEAKIHRVECSVHTYIPQASVRAVFTGLTASGQPFMGAVSRHLGYVDDEWLPTCFPDPVARHLAQRLLNARREWIEENR